MNMPLMLNDNKVECINILLSKNMCPRMECSFARGLDLMIKNYWNLAC